MTGTQMTGTQKKFTKSELNFLVRLIRAGFRVPLVAQHWENTGHHRMAVQLADFLGLEVNFSDVSYIIREELKGQADLINHEFSKPGGHR